MNCRTRTTAGRQGKGRGADRLGGCWEKPSSIRCECTVSVASVTSRRAAQSHTGAEWRKERALPVTIPTNRDKSWEDSKTCRGAPVIEYSFESETESRGASCRGLGWQGLTRVSLFPYLA